MRAKTLSAAAALLLLLASGWVGTSTTSARQVRVASSRHSKSFRVAHMTRQGITLNIIPLTAAFGRMSLRQERKTLLVLQLRAGRAGLRGFGVPVWETGDGGFWSLAPKRWRPFFASINMEWVVEQENWRITCFY